MADIDLPVFSFRPDWKDGITEHLMFLTNILKAEEGATQTRKLRMTPRRQIDADFLLVGPERTFYDLFMHKLGSDEIMVPLYWEVGRIAAATVAGVTDRLNFDTTYTEFAPGLAILQAASAMDYEVVEIESVDDTGVDLVTATGRVWPKGTRIMPLRRSLIEDMGSLSHPSASVSRVSAQFISTVANPWDVGTDDAPVYGGFPVLTTEPNWVENLAVQLARDAVRFDNQTGLPYQTDPIGRANVGQGHRYFLNGRQALAKFRDLVYRHEGRAGSFWLPTFKADLKMKASVGSGATQIVVENVGLNYINAPTSGRDHLAIMLKDGTVICRRITDVDPGTTSATEKIDLDAPVGLALSPGQVRKISFLDRARFDQDNFEIVHHAESVGLSEVNTVFRTFKDSRDPSGVIVYPIPAAEMDLTGCGEGGDGFDDCYYNNATFQGWDYRLRAVFTTTICGVGGLSILEVFAPGGGHPLPTDPSVVPNPNPGGVGPGMSAEVIKHFNAHDDAGYGTAYDNGPDYNVMGDGIGDWAVRLTSFLIDYADCGGNLMNMELYFQAWNGGEVKIGETGFVGNSGASPWFYFTSGSPWQGPGRGAANSSGYAP